MADRLAGGNLASLLAQFEAEGLAWEQVAKRLYVAHGIEVTGETLRKWAALLNEAGEVVA